MLLLDKIFIYRKLTLTDDTETKDEGESHGAFGSFLSATGSTTGRFGTLPPSDTLDLHGGNSMGVELKAERW